MELNVTAAAQAYLANHRAAAKWRRGPAEAPPSERLVAARAMAALTAAEEVWHALTGLYGQEAMDYAEEAAVVTSRTVWAKTEGS